jgi:hypothetical protein
MSSTPSNVACSDDSSITYLLQHDRIQKFYPCRLQTDAPLASIYLAIVGGNDLWLRSEVEIFSKPTWSVFDILWNDRYAKRLVM